MSEPETGPPPEDRLLQEAATWFARMRGPEAEASRGEFEAWLARGALHRRAYNRAAEIFLMGKVLGEEDDAPAPNGSRRDSRPTGLLAAVLFALVVVLALGLVVWRSPFDNDAPSSRVADNDAEQITSVRQLATGPGETLTVRLVDGSVLRLGKETSIGVRFDARLRRLTLRRGEARFEVARGARPFVVHVGGGRVTARGTTFDIDVAANQRVTVRLIEGTVDVALPGDGELSGPPTAPRRLHPGERLSFVAREAIDEKAEATEATATAAGAFPLMPQAAQDYESVSVTQLIEAANSGSSRPIRLEDPQVSQLQVSGRFRIDDPELLAERIAALFDLTVDRSRPAEIVLTPR